MTTISVVDTETTGDGEQDQVCEIAAVMLNGGVVTNRWSTLVKPTCPMDVRARAVHHITDDELAGAWTMFELLQRRGLPELNVHQVADARPWPAEPTNQSVTYYPDLVVVGHNLEFDIRMLWQTELEAGAFQKPARQLCTWRCAMHLYQDAPSHKLQVLRYWLELDEGFIALASVANKPHRALFDANVCAALLLRMLEGNTLDHLLWLSGQPVLLQTVRFGEHEGKGWYQVPRGYLEWIVRQGPEQLRVPGMKKKGFDKDTLHTARHHLAQYDHRDRAPPPDLFRQPGEGR